MSNLVEIKSSLSNFVFGDLDALIFEKWLYKAKEVEFIFGENQYLELVSFNYKMKDDLYQAKRDIGVCFENAFGYPLCVESALQILHEMESNKIGIILGCKRLDDLIEAGCDSINLIFSGYSDSLESNPEFIDIYNSRVLLAVDNEIERLRMRSQKDKDLGSGL